MKDGVGQIQTHCSKRMRVFISSVKATRHSTDAKHIHRLRVSIKKIRALIRFLDAVEPRKARSLHRYFFKTLFRKAGALREIQMNKLLLERFKQKRSAFSSYELFLINEKKRADFVFLKTLLDFDLQKVKDHKNQFKKALSSLKKNKIRKNVNAFLAKRIRKVKKILGGPQYQDGLHLIRKHLKVLEAVLALSCEITKEAELKKLLVPVRQINIRLGKLHDKQILSSDIEHFLATSVVKRPSDLHFLQSLLIGIRQQMASGSGPLKQKLLDICSLLKKNKELSRH